MAKVNRKCVKAKLIGDRSRKLLKLGKHELNRVLVVFENNDPKDPFYGTPYIKKGTDGKVYKTDVELINS